MPQVTSVNLVIDHCRDAQQCFSQGTRRRSMRRLALREQQPAAAAVRAAFCRRDFKPATACPAASRRDLGSELHGVDRHAQLSRLAPHRSPSINTETNHDYRRAAGHHRNYRIGGRLGSSAGYFSTCPPKSISVTLANGADQRHHHPGCDAEPDHDHHWTPTVTRSPDCRWITSPPTRSTSRRAAGGASPPAFPAWPRSMPSASRPPAIRLRSIMFGLYGTGLSISSNPVNITVPGTASDYVWFAAPGQSQYFVPVELLTGRWAPRCACRMCRTRW